VIRPLKSEDVNGGIGRRLGSVQRDWYAKIKALNAYGGKCKCCGENEPKFLAIDHENGGGNEHRKTIGNQTIYLWLKKNNYPKGFRVLCHNCNMAIAFWKICPHKQNGITKTSGVVGIKQEA
jgi:hypothetical protein